MSSARKIDVLLDSSVLRQDLRRRKAAFRSLDRLARSGRVRVHIPAVVDGEYESQLNDTTTGPYVSAVENLKKAKRKASRPGGERDVEKLIRDAEKLAASEKEHVGREWRAWKDEADVVVHPVADDHGRRVISAYFAGEPPFRQPKCREDIPDAFILEVARDVLRDCNELTVVVADSKLREALGAMKGVTPLVSLDELIASGPIQAAIEAQSSEGEKVVRKWMGRILVESERERKLVADLIENTFVRQVAEMSISGPQIPSDDNSASIAMVDRPLILELAKEKAEYYGDGVITVPIHCRTVVTASYYVFRGDWYGLDESRSISVSDYGNDHYWEAEEEIPVDVKGLLSIKIDLHRIPIMREDELGELDLVADLWDLAEFELDEVEEVSVPEEFPARGLERQYLPPDRGGADLDGPVDES